MSSSQPPEPISSLVGLRPWCDEQRFSIEDIDADEALITDEDGGGIWQVLRIEGWLHIKAVIFEDVEENLALCLTLARLHARLLGCRYSIENEANLNLHTDLYPHDQTGSAVGAAILQMQSIVDCTYDLIAQVLDHGEAADEGAIDKAFGFEDEERPH